LIRSRTDLAALTTINRNCAWERPFNNGVVHNASSASVKGIERRYKSSLGRYSIYAQPKAPESKSDDKRSAIPTDTEIQPLC